MALLVWCANEERVLPDHIIAHLHSMAMSSSATLSMHRLLACCVLVRRSALSSAAAVRAAAAEALLSATLGSNCSPTLQRIVAQVVDFVSCLVLFHIGTEQ
jgi:hypothetical protein